MKTKVLAEFNVGGLLASRQLAENRRRTQWRALLVVLYHGEIADTGKSFAFKGGNPTHCNNVAPDPAAAC